MKGMFQLIRAGCMREIIILVGKFLVLQLNIVLNVLIKLDNIINKMYNYKKCIYLLACIQCINPTI